MLEGPFAGKDSKHRFEREIALVGSLHHPGIVPIFDSGVAAGRFYYAMEYVRGEPLSRHVQSRRLSVDDTLRLFQVARCWTIVGRVAFGACSAARRLRSIGRRMQRMQD